MIAAARWIRRNILTWWLIVAASIRGPRLRGHGPRVSILCIEAAWVDDLRRRTRYRDVQIVTTVEPRRSQRGWKWTTIPDADFPSLLAAATGEQVALVVAPFRPINRSWLAALVAALESEDDVEIAGMVPVRPGRRDAGVAWEYRVGRELAWPGAWIGGLDVVVGSFAGLPDHPVEVEILGGPCAMLRRVKLRELLADIADDWLIVDLSWTARSRGGRLLSVPGALAFSDAGGPATDLASQRLSEGAKWFAGRWAPPIARHLRLRGLAQTESPGGFERLVGGPSLDVREAADPHPYRTPSGRIPVAILGRGFDGSDSVDGFEVIAGRDHHALDALDSRVAAITVLLPDEHGASGAHHAERLLLDGARRAVLAPRIGWRIGPRSIEAIERWGDTHLARHLAAAFKRIGFASRISPHPFWDDPGHQDVDIVVHLQGLRSYNPKPAHFNVLWIISHPDRVEPADLVAYDLVLVASDRFASDLARVSPVPVATWLQSTNPEVFRPTGGDPEIPLLFVGNSRGTERPMVTWAVERDLPLAIYGGDWEGLVPGRFLVSEHVPNHLVPSLYGRAAVVLGDHWPDMASLGFVSNRTFDVLACGTPLISDHVEGIGEMFGGAVAVVDSAHALEAAYRAVTTSPQSARAQARDARRIVLERHTTHIRVAELMGIFERLAGDSPSLAAILERRREHPLRDSGVIS